MGVSCQRHMSGAKCTSSQSQMSLFFLQAYGRELSEAYEWCNKYRHSRKEAELHQAWDLYYHVFKRINKQLPSLTVLEVQYVAPALVRAQVSPCPYSFVSSSSSSSPSLLLLIFFFSIFASASSLLDRPGDAIHGSSPDQSAGQPLPLLLLFQLLLLLPLLLLLLHA